MAEFFYYEVSLTRYPVVFKEIAKSKEDALAQAKAKCGFSVWESEVEKIDTTTRNNEVV